MRHRTLVVDGQLAFVRQWDEYLFQAQHLLVSLKNIIDHMFIFISLSYDYQVMVGIQSILNIFERIVQNRSEILLLPGYFTGTATISESIGR